jgi:hypothetical protein
VHTITTIGENLRLSYRIRNVRCHFLNFRYGRDWVNITRSYKCRTGDSRKLFAIVKSPVFTARF